MQAADVGLCPTYPAGRDDEDQRPRQDKRRGHDFVRRAFGFAEGMAERDGDRHHRLPLVGRAGHGVDVCCGNLLSTFEAIITEFIKTIAMCRAILSAPNARFAILDALRRSSFVRVAGTMDDAADILTG